MNLTDERIRTMLVRRASVARVDQVETRLAAALVEIERLPRPIARRRRRWTSLVAAAAVIAAVVAIAGGTILHQVGPNDVTAPKRGSAAARVDAVLAAYTDATPGCAVAIAQDGVVVHAAGYGLADLFARAPITPATRFDVAGVSSEFTAAAVLLLAQEGRLTLADDVHRFVPELPSYPQPLSIRALLYRQASFPDFVGLIGAAGYGPANPPSEAQSLALLAAAPLDAAPTTTFEVPTSNYYLLRIVVERASGQSFGQFVADRILAPLGMSASDYTPAGAARPSFLAVPYRDDSAGGVSRYGSLPVDGDLAGPGGLRTSALDLLKWAANFTTGAVGGSAFLRDQLAPGSLDGTGTFAAGIHLWQVHGRQLILQAGGWPQSGYRAALVIDPADRLAVALACNVSSAVPSSLAFAVIDAWLTSGPSRS